MQRYSFLDHPSRSAPEASAVVDGCVQAGGRLLDSESFLELGVAASAIADRLEARGVGRGMRVLMLVKPSI